VHPTAAVATVKYEMESDKNLIYFSTFILSFLESEEARTFYVLCFNVANIVVASFINLKVLLLLLLLREVIT